MEAINVIETGVMEQYTEPEKNNKPVKKMFWGLFVTAIASNVAAFVLLVIAGVVCEIIYEVNVADSTYNMYDSLANLLISVIRVIEAIVFCKIIRNVTFKEFREEKLHLVKMIPFAIIVTFCVSTLVVAAEFRNDLTLINVIRVLVVAPIFEELMFRGAIQRVLKSYCGELFAVLITTTLFVLYHMNRSQIITPLILGLLAGYFASKYSLKGAIVIHFLCNLQSFIYAINSDVCEVIMTITMIGTIVVLVMKFKKIIKFFKQKPEKGMLKNVVLSLPLLLFVIVCVIGIILNG